MDYSFGELLKVFRVRLSVTQEALASNLHVSRNTISAWERFLYLPHDRDIVLHLADKLELNDAETDQLLRAADFPAVNATSARIKALHQLRAPVPSFVGRTKEIGRLREALTAASSRGGVATISGVRGMGGVGKTELAYKIASELVTCFPDAQIVVDLRGSSQEDALTPLQALQVVIRAFGLERSIPNEQKDAQNLYRSLLHGKQALILADDAGDAQQVYPLLPPVGCALLVTSRVRFDVPGMVTTVDLEQISNEEAVALLCDICNRLSTTDAQEIAHLCGNLPLALQVSSGILRNNPSLSIARYIALLDDERQRLAQLRAPGDLQLDVEASLTSSYTLLDTPTQQIFRQLGVLVADFALSMALAVIAAPPDVSIENTLSLLLLRNLVMYNSSLDRWRLHDLTRVFALRQLEEVGELDAVHLRYARYAVQVVSKAQDQYLEGKDGVRIGLEWFDTERPHLDAARRWATDHIGTSEGDRLLLDDASATLDIGELRYDQREERIPQLENALDAAQRTSARRSEGQICNSLGNAYGYLGETQSSISYYEQALAIYRDIGDRCSEARTLCNLGITYAERGKTREAIPYFEQSLAVARDIGDRRSKARTLCNLGLVYVMIDDALCAITYYEEALSIIRDLGDQRGECLTLGDLGEAYIALGNAQRAIECSEASLEIAQAIGDRRLEGYAWSYLGRAAELNDRGRTASAFEQAISILHKVGDRFGEAQCSWQFGRILLAQQKERARALRLLRACTTYLQEINHSDAEVRGALLARLEAGEDLPPEDLPS